MQGKIRPWGNDLGIRIDKKLLKAAHFKVGDLVEITAENERIVIQAAKVSNDTTSEAIAELETGKGKKHQDIKSLLDEASNNDESLSDD